MNHHTHREIANPYLRCLLARELLGLRRAQWRAVKAGHPFDERTMSNFLYATDTSFTRIALHLQRHGAAMLAGDSSPLAQYPATFAGHI